MKYGWVIAMGITMMCLGGVGLQAQEICDNGADDDGNGLIDLNDPACECNGITSLNDVTYFINNPSFEDFGCCPSNYSQLACATGWINGNQGSPDYFHTCGFLSAPLNQAGLVPFPDGEGIGGLIFSSDWKEYLANCLDEPLKGGLDYTLRFHIASTPITGGGAICNNGEVYYPAVPVVLYGHISCGFYPLPSLGCPSGIDPNWVVLGSAIYSPAGAWEMIEISFTPGQDIAAIMIGAPCSLPAEYASAQPCYPYFFFDGFTLEEETPVPPITLTVSGHPCANDLTLNGIASVPGGTWQWYFNGVAIPGETQSSFFLPLVSYQPGVYTVMYSMGEDCDLAEVTLDFELPETTLEEVYFCPGDTAACAGTQYTEEGYYEVVLTSYLGCDSVVGCLVFHHPSGPNMDTILRQCGADTLIVCGDTLTRSGIYTSTCTSIYGCESEALIDIAFLEPEAIIGDYPDPGCDSTFSILLDGSLSSRNTHPQGVTLFAWTGPPGGIVGSASDTMVQTKLPGTYCLILTHGVDSFYCTDTVCVTLGAGGVAPATPLIAGGNAVCAIPGALQIVSLDTLGIKDSLRWYAQMGLQWEATTDSTLVFSALQAGNYEVCVFAENSCGVSDTVCLMLSFLPVYTTEVVEITCDSLLAGMDTILLQSMAGCDSLVITETIYSGSYQSVEQVVICGNGVPYSDTLIVTTGPCDSVFIKQYEYQLPVTIQLNEGSCDPFQTGVFTVVLTDMSGCDSTIITTVNLLPTDTTIINGVTCDILEAGETTQTLDNQYGCDSIVQTLIAYVGIDTQYVSLYSCDSSQVGVQSVVLPGLNCDTVRVTNTQWSAYSIGFETVISCDLSGPSSDTTLFANQNGCDSLHIRQYVYSELAGVLLVEDERCAGQNNGQVAFSDASGGLPPYSYRLNTGSWQNEPVFSGLGPGVYTVSIRDMNGCIRVYTGMEVFAGQVFSVEVGPDRKVAPGSYIDLSLQATEALSQIQWTATDPIACPGCAQTVLGPITGPHTVFLTVVSASGCPGTDDFGIIMTGGFVKVYIPNSFSPNNDGINDVFSIYGNDQVVGIRNLAIYDRWGNALYYRTDLPVNDPSAGWDGTFRDEMMDPGVYVYVVEVELVDGSVRLYKGDVTLVK